MKGHTGEYPPGPAWLRPLALGNTTEDDTPAVPQAPAPRTRRWPGLVSTLFSALVLVAAGCLALAGLQVLQGKAAQPNLLAHILRGPATSNAHTLPTSGLAQAPEIADGAGVWLEGLPGLLQKPELPNGCEATSLAIVLNFWGFEADKLDIAYNHIPRQDFTTTNAGRLGPNPAQAYAGDPADNFGFYCLAPAVAAGANSYLQQAGSLLQAQDISGSDTAALEGWLDAGCPVVFWLTLDGGEARYAPRFYWLLPDGTEYRPYANLHCVVLRGYNDTQFYLCDPLQVEVAVDKAAAMAGYQALGENAVVVCP